MNNKGMGLQNGVTNVEETDKSNSGELIERKNIEGTPFTAIKRDGQDGWFLTMGQYRVTGGLEKLEDLEYKALQPDWELITVVVGIMIERFNEVNKG